MKTAKVLIADYELLKKDFPQISSKNEEEINEWLLDQVAYLAEGQINRMKTSLASFLDFDTQHLCHKIIDFEKKKSGVRYRGTKIKN